MNFEFSLSEIDFLTYQLYNASKKKSIKNQRRKSWILVTLAFLVLGISFYEYKKISAYLFFACAILSLIIYPFYLKDYYRNHYLKYVRETLKNRYDQSVIIKFESEHVELIDSNSETKINHAILEGIDEIENYIFIRIKTGGGIIIPKKRIERIEELKEELNKIAVKYNLKTNLELDWKWK
jgi:hypothetical protein